MQQWVSQQARRIVYWRWKTNLTRITWGHDAQLRALRRERRCGAGCGLLESGAAIRTAEGGAEHVQPLLATTLLTCWMISVRQVTPCDHFQRAGETAVQNQSASENVLVLGQEYEGLPDAARDPNDCA